MTSSLSPAAASASAVSLGNAGSILGNLDDNNCTHFLGWIFNNITDNCSKFPHPDASMRCLIDGQNDVYGMGIRIGLYLQWSSTVLTFLFHPSTFPQLLVTNAIFSIAVSIAYLVIRQVIYRHEVFIVAMLLMMTLMMVPLELMEFILFYDAPTPPPLDSPEHPDHPDNPAANIKRDPEEVQPHGPLAWLKKHFATIGDVSWIIATTFLLIIVGWQYTRGPDAADLCPCCDPRLLGTHYMEQPYAGILYAAFSLLALVALLAIVWFAWTRLKKKKPTGQHFKDEHWHRRIPAAAFFGAVMSFSVAYIETAVYQNRIQDVGTVKDAGQIIPLVIGVASFTFTLYEVLKECF